MNRRTFIEGAAALGLAGLVAEEAAAFSSTRLSVVVRGSGPDVILIPGLTSGRGVWDGLVRALPGYRYHLVQVAGFAGDPARGNASGQVVSGVANEIARYIADARLATPAVIGHSMGGVVAMMVAARFPARIGRVMAVDILPAPAAGFGFDAAGLKPFADALFGSLSATPEGRQTLERLVGGYGGGAVARSRSDSNVVARATHELATTDLTPELPRIRAPFTIVYATPSDATAAAGVDRRYRLAYARAPNARLRRMPGSGHMVMLDKPARFAAEVETFLKPGRA
jgi:pimeloyl-ACP methyl ester carboxylesterase